MANTKVTGDLIASSTIATGNIADNAVTSAKISGITTAHITEGSNLYYTDARARAAVSVSGNALSYNSSTGVITSNFEESPTFTGNVLISSNGDATQLQIKRASASQDNGLQLQDQNGNKHAIFNLEGTTTNNLQIASSQQILFHTSSDCANPPTSERMRITAQGLVGIGTTSPNAKLDILGPSSDQLRLRTAESEEYKIGRNTSTGLLEFYGTQSGYTGYVFGGVNGTRMTIDSSGNTTFTGKISSVKELINVNSANGIRSGGFEVQDDGDLFIGTATTAGNIVLETGNTTNGLPSTGTARLTINSTNASFSTNVMPTAENSYNIGSSSLRWEDLYVDDGFIRNAYIDEYIYHNGDTDTYIRALPNEWVLRTGGSDRLTISDSNTHFTNTSVGIGTTSPQFNLHVVGASATEATVARFAKGNYADTGGHTTIVGLGTESGATWVKAAIAFERKAGYDTGSIHFLQDDTVDNSTVQLSDSVMTIEKDGKVGIGTTGLTRQLEVNTSGGWNNGISLNSSSVDGAGLRLNCSATGGNEWYLISTGSGNGGGAGNLGFYNNTVGDYRMYITSSGNVGIGDTSPAKPLVVYSAAPPGGITIKAQSGNASNWIQNVSTGSSWQIGSTSTGWQLYNDNTSGYRVTVTNAGSVGIGTTSPAKTLDIRTDNGVLIKGASGSTNASLSFLPASGGREYAFSNDGSSFYIKDISADVTRMYFHYNGNIGIGTTSPADKLEVSSGNIRITNNSPMLRFIDSDVTNLEHRILGGGNQGLEYSADVLNVTAGYHRWDIANTEKMRLVEGGNLGIGTTSPLSKLDARGALMVGSAAEDSNFSSTTATGMSNSESGMLEITQGWVGSGSSGDTVVFTYAATSWKSWGLEWNFMSTQGMSSGFIGGYNNNSTGHSKVTHNNAHGVTVTFTKSTQTNIITFTFTALGTHPMASFRYYQSGGDGRPYPSKASITMNS